MYKPLYVVEVPAARPVLAALIELAARPARVLLVAGDPGPVHSDETTVLNLDAPLCPSGLRELLGVFGIVRLRREPGLAVRLARLLDADHLRLADGGAPADDGIADIALADGTRRWRATPPAADLELLSRAVEISSVSGDERELACFLAAWAAGRGLDARVDPAGNLVVTRGTGPGKLLLLGHLDTVPFRWPVRWSGDTITGRGCVDAKASLVAFLEVLASADVPEHVQLRVVGAVQEEVTSAGAFYVRDHYAADAVIVGEPSGSAALTVGYHGLCKVRVTISQPSGHPAGRGARTAADRLIDLLFSVRTQVGEGFPGALLTVLRMTAADQGDRQCGEAVFDVRVPPGADTGDLVARIRRAVEPTAEIAVSRCTPGVLTPRSSALVHAFTSAFRAAGIVPRYLAKKGSSDMNTLASGTAWHSVPMVAYGPGDAALDHTPHERLTAAEYRQAKTVLASAVANWISAA